MNLLRKVQKSTIALAAVLAASTVASAQLPTFPGGVGSGGSSQPVNWIYDTGAAVTLVPMPTMIAAGYVVPNGFTRVNGAVAACFINVPVGCVDSAGNLCTNTATVYSFIAPNPIGGAALLGRDLRKAFNGTWNDRTERVTWGNPGPLPPLKDALGFSLDLRTGVFHDVVNNVQFASGGNSASCDMTILNGSSRTFIPLSVALQLNPVITGVVDLWATDPWSVYALYIAEQNSTLQTQFIEIEVDSAQLPIGPNSGRVRVLVSADENSDFGAIGRDFLISTESEIYRLHETPSDTYISLSGPETADPSDG